MSPRRRLAAVVAFGLALAVCLAVFVSPLASGAPDGLTRVAADKGLDRGQTEHGLAHLPTAGYAVPGVDGAGVSKGLAGILGVTATFLLAGGVTVATRRAARRRDPSDA